MTQITGGELLLKCLKAEGMSMIFGVLDGSFNTWLAKLGDYEMDYICPLRPRGGFRSHGRGLVTYPW